MSGDFLTFIKIHTGDADQSDIGIVNDRLAADLFMDLCGDIQSFVEIILIHTNEDMIEFTAVKQVDDQFNVGYPDRRFL